MRAGPNEHRGDGDDKDDETPSAWRLGSCRCVWLRCTMRPPVETNIVSLALKRPGQEHVHWR